MAKPVLSRRLAPPHAVAQAGGDGWNSKPWTDYHQKVADQLTDLQTAVNNYITGVTPGGGMGLGTLTTTDIATMELPRGDWLVEGNITFSLGSNTVATRLSASISDTSATIGAMATDLTGTATLLSPGSILISTFARDVPQQIGTGGAALLTGPITAYLVGRCAFFIATTLAPGGSCTATGNMWARQLR